MSIDVKVEENYRGPFDLLLYLIKRDEIDIHDIPISHITREYLTGIEQMEEINVEICSEFLTLASMLMEIKSRMLLPPEEVENDEETVEFDPRAGLVEALMEYKKFKEAAGELAEMYDLHSKRFPRAVKNVVLEVVNNEQMIEANVYDLYAAFAKIMRETLSATAATTIIATEISTEECIDNIEAKLTAQGKVSFSELFASAPSRPLMVAYFIAILELVRLHRIQACQSADFSDIYLEPGPDEVLQISNFEPLKNCNTLGEYVNSVVRILHLPCLVTTGRTAPQYNTAVFLSPLITVKVKDKTCAQAPAPLFPVISGRSIKLPKTKFHSPQPFPNTTKISRDLL